MRLIDADAFKKYIRDACNEMSHVYKDGGKWAKQITEDFCMDIDEQPTIEERKTGKWIETGTINHSYICSVCGRMLVNITDGKNKVVEHYPFCHCGARMVQEGEDNG